MTAIDPTSVTTAQLHAILLSAVAPRPIALASTIDAQGQVNLSPFSFFNAFSAHPPILIFSPARRVRDNTEKHTLVNALQVPEVVINVVEYAMVEQMSLSSTEYAAGVNEFIKAGFTQAPSIKVKPPSVKESPVAFECKVLEIKPLGDEGGAGNLIICEVVMVHIQERLLMAENKIDPTRLDLVARMGGNWYARANERSRFEIPKPGTSVGMGFDQLPESVKSSRVLTGNELGRLAHIEQLPSQEAIRQAAKQETISEILNHTTYSFQHKQEALHRLAQAHLAKEEVFEAWCALLQL